MRITTVRPTSNHFDLVLSENTLPSREPIAMLQFLSAQCKFGWEIQMTLFTHLGDMFHGQITFMFLLFKGIYGFVSILKIGMYKLGQTFDGSHSKDFFL